ncbi:ABC transporter ATP-binding protein [Methanohalophilus euhalobius]|jgi:ABC-type multidrug transport system ATPase subunit|uniref:Heme exporter protein A n=2 Tax=Methanohalophilus euhalobius TaxID=51203 RepID=A0A315B8E2_9EURY|nr:ABC transporter ATP-binding protein [Methanohalophilus euhalobius]PQV42389.1 heme exporter protein A [Methanohalophilus euhalobius]
MMGETILVAEGIFRDYGCLHALNGINLRVEEGEFIAIIGPNGAGKSSLLKIFASLLSPTKGTLQIFGTKGNDREDVQDRIGMLSHDTLLYDNLTARENLLFFGKLYGMEHAALAERCDYLIRKVGLWKRAEDPVKNFSRGMKQRLSFARAIIHDPSLLLLDEPYTGLDMNASSLMENLLMENPAVTKIMVTHDLDKAFRLCSRLLIMEAGNIVHDVAANDPNARNFAEAICSSSGGQFKC